MIKRDAINEILLSLNELPLDDDDIIEAYPRIYMGTRESSNHVELNLIDARNAMEDW